MGRGSYLDRERRLGRHHSRSTKLPATLPRNLHALSLNIFKDEGREAFLKLMEPTDIFIEASKGPAFARRGITDEVLWQHNPKLVIAHLSGFGQYGTEEYTNLPAYNTIAQA
ncbi:CoA transferase, partial [Escherichia coli]|uniref:CoA transferase n=1 Tax=Escherichia coli TaxID=562 RepID=UPI003D32DC4B